MHALFCIVENFWVYTAYAILCFSRISGNREVLAVKFYSQNIHHRITSDSAFNLQDTCICMACPVQRKLHVGFQMSVFVIYSFLRNY